MMFEIIVVIIRFIHYYWLEIYWKYKFRDIILHASTAVCIFYNEAL